MEELPGALELVEVGGLVGVGADEDGDVEVAHVEDGGFGWVEVVVAALVETAGVDFGDEALLADEVDGFVDEVAEPLVGVGEIAVAVVHDDFVEMADDGGAHVLDHGVVLMEEGADAGADVAVEDALKAFVVGGLLAAVDEPEVVGVAGAVAEVFDHVGVGEEVDGADDVLESALLDERGEVVEDAGDVVDFETQLDVDAAGVFLLERSDLVAIGEVVVLGDGEAVVEGDGGVAAEAEGGEVVGEGVLYVVAELAFAVAVVAMSVVVGVIHCD